MRRPGNRASRRSPDEQGAITVIVALVLVTLLIVAAIVIDFGLVRLNRQENKSTADAAVMAGLRAADGGTSDIFPQRGVCTALAYLKANDPALNGLSQDIPSAMPSAVTCTDTVATSSMVACDPDDPAASMTDYQDTVTNAGVTYTVRIKSPYEVDEGNFSDESYSTLVSDRSELNGCDQVAVIITQSRKSLFGSIATSEDLTTTIRSVGRVAVSAGDDAPALLLLRRTGCPVLATGSNSGGSKIRLYGAVSSDGRSSAGTIHADSNGVTCTGGSNQNVLLGKAANGIVAFAAPSVTNPLVPDPGKPGVISAVSAITHEGPGVTYDALDNVFGSGALDDAGIPGFTKSPTLPRSLVTRKLIDQRYFTGVKAAMAQADSVFTTVNAGNAASLGYVKVSNCNPTAADLTAAGITASTTKIFIDCTHNNGYRGVPALTAETIMFNGVINPGTVISMPRATKVYINGLPNRDAITLTGGGGLSIHTEGNIAGTTCTNATRTAGNKAVVVVRQGSIKESNGGLLRMCNTTLLSMGGQADGCVPATEGTAPSQTPCAGTMGTGQLDQTGGDVDWTAPNSLDVIIDPATGNASAAATAGWKDSNGPEDLAFWSESAGNNSSTTYNMNGQGLLHTVGVYMVPNAHSFIIGGGASQHLTNAQYIASSISLNGTNTAISMRVDPNSVVTLPKLDPFTLVR